MRPLLVLLLVACGQASGELDAGGGDAGGDAGASGPFLFVCDGYTYCRGADGGPDPQPVHAPYCTYSVAEAKAAHNDGGRAREANGDVCLSNFICATDGGGC